MNNLKFVRESKNLTQKEVAKMSNISFRSYQNYETNKQIPNVYAALAISKVLDSSIEKLFTK